MDNMNQNQQPINWKFMKRSRVEPSTYKEVKRKVSGKPTLREDSEAQRENLLLLHQWESWWNSLSDYRTRRKRVRNYLRGKQWEDIIADPRSTTGETIKEHDYIVSQGKVPLKQNIMSQLKNNIVGRFRSNQLKPMVVARDKNEQDQSEMLSNALQHAHSINDCKELDSANFLEFVMSGMPVAKVGYKYWRERNLEDAWVQNVNPNRFFFNTDISDIRHTDVRVVGEIHDLTLDEVKSVFARNSADEEMIEQWYRGYGTDNDTLINSSGLTSDRIDSIDFLIPMDTNKCRVIEGWYLKAAWRTYVHDYLTGEYYITDKSVKEVMAENQQRINDAMAAGVDLSEVPLKEAESKYEQYWYFKFLTPFGKCLYEGETKYKHESHPYAFVTYPLVDGEVWGMFEEIIDQQRYINRLITMMDFMIGSSAKGVLMVPEDAIPDDMDIDDFAEEWSRYNGVIKIKAKAGSQLPQQIVSRGTSVGIGEMLQLQMKLMQEISGVNYAIQGQKAGSSTPSSLYAQEAENSSLNSKDVMETYAGYLKRRDQKLLKVVHQFYDEKRMLNISGDASARAIKMYEPEKVADLDFDVEIAQTVDTPVFRQITDDILLGMLKDQFIDITTYLEHSSMPFAKPLLETVKAKQLELTGMQQGMQQGMPPQQPGQEQAGQQQPNVDPRLMELAQRMMQQPEKKAA